MLLLSDFQTMIQYCFRKTYETDYYFKYYFMNDNYPIQMMAKADQSAQLPQQNILASKCKSNLLDEYYRLICGPSFEPIDQEKLACMLIHQGIKYNREYAQQKLQIIIEEYSSNYEALKLNVSYGFFCTSLYLINIDVNKTFSNSAGSLAGTGAFGRVEKCFADGELFAVKSIKFDEEEFSQIFPQIIKECFLLKIASALRVGPNARSIFGFDVVVYRNCFDFNMEFCEPASLSDIPQSLERKLSILHHFNIVHLDIKPQNIAFSNKYDDYIFIDFGLSRAIKENIGEKSYTSFAGSLLFCCSQMLELYNNETKGFVDLYYNDSYSLHSTKLPGSSKKQYEIKEFDFFSQFGQWMDESLLILRQKFELFLFGCQLSYSDTVMNTIISSMKKQNLLGFALTLPQRCNIIAHYKKLMKTTQYWSDKSFNFDQDLSCQDADKFSSVFNGRFTKIAKMNHENLFVGKPVQSCQLLFEVIATKQFQFQTYCLKLIQFIKINSHHDSFQKKIKACQVFRQQHLKEQIIQQSTSLYRSVVKHIFTVALTSKLPQRCQILRNSIQTVVVLEIVPQNIFIEAYFAVFEWNIRNIRKVRLAFEVITSLQFVKEKYRKTYNYEKLVKAFMAKLNNFINSILFFVKDQQQTMVFKDIQLLIEHLQSPTPKMASLSSILYEQKKYHQIEVNKLSVQVQIYLAAYELLRNKSKFIQLRSQQLSIIYNRLDHIGSYSRVFTFAHFALFHVLCTTEQLSKTQQIYFKFVKQFQPFQEHTYFGIHFLHQLNSLKLTFSYLPSHYHEFQLTMHSYQACKEIFRILQQLIQNTDKFHYFLSCTLLFFTQIKLAIFSDRLYQLIKLHINKILRISNDYHKIIQKHNHKIKNQVTLFNRIFDFVSEYEQYNSITEDHRININILDVAIIFNRVISGIQCIQCKVYAFLQLKMTFNYIKGDLVQTQSQFLSIVDTLIVIFKHKQFKKAFFPLMAFLIKSTLQHSQLVAKYQILDLFYEYIRQFNCYYYSISNIRKYNIFIEMYIMISKKYPEQIVSFIFLTAMSLSNNNPTLLIDRFYYSLIQMVQYNMKKHPQSCKNLHDGIIEGLFYYLKSYRNPCLALYFSALLEVQFPSNQASKMLKFICRSLNQLSKQARRIILNHYYNSFDYYMPASQRKSSVLMMKFFKNCQDLIPLRQIIKTRLKMKIDSHQINFRKYLIFKQFVVKYHVNLDNVN